MLHSILATRAQVILLAGADWSGRRDIGEWFRAFGFTHLNIGYLLGLERSKNEEFARKYGDLMDQGIDLDPQVVLEFIRPHIRPHNRVCISDLAHVGEFELVYNHVCQVIGVESCVGGPEHKRPPTDSVWGFFFDVTPEASRSRGLLSGRAEKYVQKRIEQHHPALEGFREAMSRVCEPFFEINGNVAQDEVRRQVHQALQLQTAAV